jgi:ATP-dependent DNA helicase RecG
VICPRIEEPDPDKQMAVNSKSVIAEAARLKKDIFKTSRIAPLHGKMTPKEKDDIMMRFNNHEIDVLVATSVVAASMLLADATT